jgi:hypothetical protein
MRVAVKKKRKKEKNAYEYNDTTLTLVNGAVKLKEK